MTRELLRVESSPIIHETRVESAIYIPDNLGSHDEIKEEVSSKAEFDLTGIATRYKVCGDREKVIVEMGKRVVSNTLNKKGWQAEEIDYLLVATSFPYGYSPSKQIAELTGAENANLGDYYAACASFAMALHDLYNKPPQDGAKIVLVASEQYSTKLLPKDKIFGDGASALAWEWNEDLRILASIAQVVWDEQGIIKMPIKNELYPPSPLIRLSLPMPHSEQYVEMSGKTVLGWIEREIKISKNGQDLMHPIDILTKTCDEAGLTIEELDCLIPHQSSGKAVDALKKFAKNIGFRGRFIKTVEDYGNTSSDTIPRALHIANQEEPFKPGAKVGLVSFSAGFVVSSSILEILR